MFDEKNFDKFPKIQINNINEKMTRHDIDQRFGKYGKILGINMQATYIQVVFDDESAANQALRHEHMTQLREKRIEVVMVNDKGNRLGGNNNVGRGRGARIGPGGDRMGPGLDRMGPGSDRMGLGIDRMGPGSDRMGPGSDRMGPGSDRMGPGSDRMGSGLERMGPGSERMSSGSDRMGLGSDRMGLGSDRMGPGSDRMGPGSDRMGPGSDRMGPGSDRMGAGSDRMGAGSDRMGAGSDRMGAGSDRMGAGSDRMGPGSDRMGPGSDRMGPGSDRMGPGSDRMGPGSDRMGPGSDRMGPGSDRMGAGSDRMGPGSDRMGSGGDRFRDAGLPLGRVDQFRDQDLKRSFDDNYTRGSPMGMGNGPRGLDGESFSKQGRFDGPRDPPIPPRGPDSFGAFATDSFPAAEPKVNDCEILVMSKLQQVYAELIEQRLKNIGLTVDLMFMRDEMAVMRALNEMSKKGTFYAVVITNENEMRGSLTLNILQGPKPQEHRNMPMDDALKMVARTFTQMRQEKRGLGAGGTTTPIDREIHFILNLMMNGKYLTIPELDRVLNFIQDLRDRQALAENIPVSTNRPVTTSDAISKTSEPQQVDPMVEQQNLQQRILNIISAQNNTSLPQTSSSSLNLSSQSMPSNSANAALSNISQSQTQSNSQPAQGTPNTYINFDNPSVQKALDSLISSGPNLLKSISMVSGNSSSNANSANSMLNMPNRNAAGGQSSFSMPQSNSGMQGASNLQTNQSQYASAVQNMMGTNQANQNQGFRHPLMGTQIGTNQGQFFNPRGGSNMRY